MLWNRAVKVGIRDNQEIDSVAMIPNDLDPKPAHIASPGLHLAYAPVQQRIDPSGSDVLEGFAVHHRIGLDFLELGYGFPSNLEWWLEDPRCPFDFSGLGRSTWWPRTRSLICNKCHVTSRHFSAPSPTPTLVPAKKIASSPPYDDDPIPVTYPSQRRPSPASSRLPRSSTSTSTPLMIVPTGTAPYLSPLPAGPVFTATYTAPTNGTTPASANTALSSTDSGTTTVTATAVSGISTHSMTPGKKAVAILLPLLVPQDEPRTREEGARRVNGEARQAHEHYLLGLESHHARRHQSRRPPIHRPLPQQLLRLVLRCRARAARRHGREAARQHRREGLAAHELGERRRRGCARRPKTHLTPPDPGSRAVSFADSAHPRPNLSNSVYSRSSRAFHTGSTYADFAGEEAPPVPALPSPSRVSAYGAERQSNYSGGIAFIRTARRGAVAKELRASMADTVPALSTPPDACTPSTTPPPTPTTQSMSMTGRRTR
ncbi:hypothetical protein C8R44DRAFT_856785 [Mycena epipterygia]|nr:hypothetical protein C8R44DRAFT_856785 [Mycena epipterygia]